MNRSETYAPLAQGLLGPEQDFAALLEDQESHRLAWQDFVSSRQMGVAGYPTVILRHGKELTLLCRGFIRPEDAEVGVGRWLENELGEAATGLMCGPEGCEVP